VILRRKRPDPAIEQALERFRPAAEAVDAAQRVLLAAVPTSRDPGAPLVVVLDDFERWMAEVERAMPAWRSEITEELWLRCDHALADSLAEVSRLRAEPPGPSEFEKLNAALNDVLAPLDEFAVAERRLLGRPL